MDNNHNVNDIKQEGNEMAVSQKDIKQIKQQVSSADRKAIIRNATKKAFEKYDDVFKKLSKN